MLKYLLFLTTIVFSLHAETYKAVFDCSSHDASYIKSRMWLIGKTIDMIEKQGDKADFVLTLHGGCVPIVSRSYDDVVDDEDEEDTKQAQTYLKTLAQKRGLKVIACAMSLEVNDIEQKEVLPFVKISPNSFIDTIHYQNSGYALMSLK